MQRVVTRLTYANVIATVALFLALGGSAYAVNQIDGSTIEKRSIPASRLAKRSIGPKEVNLKKVAAELPAVESAANADKVGGLPLSQLVDSAGTYGFCNPKAGELKTCARLEVTVPQRDDDGRVLIVASGLLESTGPAIADCMLGSEIGISSYRRRHVDGESELTMTALTPRLGPGRHTVTLDCRSGGGEFSFSYANLNALVVGGGSQTP